MENVNAVLTAVLTGAACLGGAVWASPRGCRWLSLRLYCRAVQLEEGRRAYREALAANGGLEEGA